MLDATQLLNGTVTTVMVGENQSLFGNRDARTSATEDNDGISHARVGLAIQLFIRWRESQFLHPRQILLVQFLQHPHSLVGVRSASRQQTEKGGFDCSFDIHALFYIL